MKERDSMKEFQRLELLIGDKINAVKEQTILIIGLGGVGGYATESLIRSGVGKLILVDNDKIDITNLIGRSYLIKIILIYLK